MTRAMVMLASTMFRFTFARMLQSGREKDGSPGSTGGSIMTPYFFSGRK